MSTQERNWSDWLNFDAETIAKTPQTPGVFRMHASMKILYIGNSENLQQGLQKTLENPCTSESSRFCYLESENHERLKEEILKEYTEKHDGKLPRCMQ